MWSRVCIVGLVDNLFTLKTFTAMLFLSTVCCCFSNTKAECFTSSKQNLSRCFSLLLFCVYKWKREVSYFQHSVGPIHPVQHNYTSYLFKVLWNQLENYSTFLEDVYKSTILLQFLCTDIKLGLCKNRGFIPLVLAETLESVLNAIPQEMQTVTL